MKIVGIVSQKGGSGKTTTAVNLGVQSAAAGKTTLLVDLDPQATATKWHDRRSDERGPEVVSAQVSRLRHVLEAARKQGADLVLLDTPPRNSEVSIEAAKVADLVLVPVHPLIHDVETLPALRDLLRFAGAPPTFVVLNDAPVQGTRHVDATMGAESMGLHVCPVRLYHRSAYGDAPNMGQGVSEYEPGGKAALEVEALYRFIFEQVNS